MNRIGIDLGGTKIEGILTTEDPMDVLVRKRVSTEQEKGYAQVLSNIAGLIRGSDSSPVSHCTLGNTLQHTTLAALQRQSPRLRPLIRNLFRLLTLACGVRFVGGLLDGVW